MRLLTQNILRCNVNKCVSSNVPLRVIVDKSEIIETDFQEQLVAQTLKKLDFTNLHKTAVDLGDATFPTELTDTLLADKDFLTRVHNMLFQFHVLEGKLLCENCKRAFPIKNGIPNLLLDETEI